MKLNNGLQLFCIVVALLSLDLLTIKGVSDFVVRFKKQNQIITYSLLWSITTLALILVVYSYSNPSQIRSAFEITKAYFVTGIIAVFYIPKLIFILFFLIDDIINIFVKILKKLNVIKKYKRLLVMHYIGFTLCLLISGILLYGWVYGRFQSKIVHETVSFSSLPKSFDGFKIAHISDIHASAFYEHNDVLNKNFEKLMKNKPDLIVITGDFVSYYAEELDGLENVFYKLQAPYGEFGVLGNHDYGDYYNWRTPEEKTANRIKLNSKLRYLGIRILNNESIMIHKGDDRISLLGVENWGPPPYQQFGNLNQAIQHVPDSCFKILLSHDPRHWEQCVKEKTDIQLTLSGHTHGMQSGITLGGKEWSPAIFYFGNWGGLYNQKEQHLYINRGLGYAGIPIRVGMPAEITIITLKTK